MPSLTALKKIGLLVGGISIALAGSYLLFVYVPSTPTELAGILLFVFFTCVGTVLTIKLVPSIVQEHNVGKITIDGKIVQEESSELLSVGGDTTSAKTIVEQIETANETVNGLIVEVNTGGGGIVPSENIRKAVADFDGPTIAYATEVCASGGYWVASGCDEIWAHEGSLIGSIGVKFSQIRIAELADKAGITYESITTGKYKEILTEFKELEPHEREKLQEIADSYHALFVDRLDDNLEVSRAIIDNEADVYVGQDALKSELVDRLGTEETVEDRMAQFLDEDVVVEDVSSTGVVSQLTGGANALAYSFGAGLGAGVARLNDSKFEF